MLLMRLTGWPYGSWFQSISCWYANICKLQSVYTDILELEYFLRVNKQGIKKISYLYDYDYFKMKDDGLKIVPFLETSRVPTWSWLPLLASFLKRVRVAAVSSHWHSREKEHSHAHQEDVGFLKWESVREEHKYYCFSSSPRTTNWWCCQLCSQEKVQAG